MKLLKKLGLSETAEIMIVVIACLYPLLLAIGLLVILFLYAFEAPLAYAAGLLVGSLLSIVKVILLERSINRAVEASGKAMAQGYAGLQAAMRYMLTIGVLVGVFFFSEIFGLIGTILGILTLQLSAYIANPILRRREKTRDA